ncbi:DUF4129 domain-containing protein [Halapricum sp. CBA1109]|uniref:DUF4129 domain-containing protein n=1 Tax=Halapricum sp. CBA1109 TaxID=2668068 RepID=UPI00351B04CC
MTDPDTKTPGEVARQAVEREGLPADPVRTLRDAFRAVEYGARDPEEYEPAVEDALEDIEATTEDDS